MADSNSLLDLFFHELKKYNSTNFKNILDADLTHVTPCTYKAYSSAVTRYFIFLEKHPEISSVEANILYFQARIDMVARYFSEYPMSNPEDLKPFQDEILRYVNRMKENEYEPAATV